MPNANGLTPTEQAMMDVLEDGDRHTRHELHSMLPDDAGRLQNISPHLTAIRKKIRPRGLEIICQYYQGAYWYRLVRVITTDE